MTKEELLQKGISEEDADQIIASFSENSQDEDNPLEALQKALKDDDSGMDDLSKAEKGEEKDSEDEKEYDEKFMKKMKRYMKEKGKMFKDEKEDMKKAVDELDLDSEGAVIEMSDLAPILEKQADFNEKMSKAIEDIAVNMSVISEKSEKGFDIMKKAAIVTAEQASGLSGFLKTPAGRKGVIADEKMAKAQGSVNDSKKIWKVLMKAIRNEDRVAGDIMGAFESAGQNVNLLKKSQKEYIGELLKEEAK